jgi:myosin-crossreactive antigen
VIVRKETVDRQVCEVVSTLRDVLVRVVRSAQVWQKQAAEDIENLNKELRKVQSSNKKHTELFIVKLMLSRRSCSRIQQLGVTPVSYLRLT